MRGTTFQLKTVATRGSSKPERAKKVPELSCKAWIVYNLTTQAVVRQFNSLQKRQVASLTKMMTMLVVIELLEKGVASQQDLVCVPYEATVLGGTTAELEEGDEITVLDLLYGLMLPSGNDAAYTLAAFFGQKISSQFEDRVQSFLGKMNEFAGQLGMKNSLFCNPHGLPDRNSYSCAADMLILAKRLIEYPLAAKVVQKKMHFCCVQGFDGWTRELFWENTNRLLGKGFRGVKTGSTKTAGYCLSLWKSVGESEILSVTLCSRDVEKRWEDNQTLWEWIEGQVG